MVQWLSWWCTWIGPRWVGDALGSDHEVMVLSRWWQHHNPHILFTTNSKWVDERAEDRIIVKDIGLQRVLLVLAMGGHRRLGACSPFKVLNAGTFCSRLENLLLKNKFDYFKFNYFGGFRDIAIECIKQILAINGIEGELVSTTTEGVVAFCCCLLSPSVVMQTHRCLLK